MDFHFHNIELKEKYAIVQIDHPPVNSLSDDVKEELFNVLEYLKPSVRGIILTGAGEKAFVAGADIRELGQLDENGGRKRVEKSKELFSYIENYPHPIIAAINGNALGGGLELALCCDICISTTNAKFGFPEVNLGIMPGGGGTQRISRVVSPGMAKLLIYTGKIIRADEAYKLGIVQQVVDKENLIEAAEAIVQMITKKAPLAIQASKKAINYGLKASFEEGLNEEINLFAKLCGTKDKNEGIEAFLNKRDPVFTGE